MISLNKLNLPPLLHLLPPDYCIIERRSSFSLFSQNNYKTSQIEWIQFLPNKPFSITQMQNKVVICASISRVLLFSQALNLKVLKILISYSRNFNVHAKPCMNCARVFHMFVCVNLSVFPHVLNIFQRCSERYNFNYWFSEPAIIFNWLNACTLSYSWHQVLRVLQFFPFGLISQNLLYLWSAWFFFSTSSPFLLARNR